jgi:hypothetical protein
LGRAKEEMMRQEELQPMYDWIEDNFGDDAGEEGSEEWEVAVQAFENYCDEQRRLDEENHRQEELEWYLYNESPESAFDKQIRNINELLSFEASDDAKFSLLVMLHGHVIASLESYLASTFIQKVTNSEALIRKLVESDPSFSKMKFTLKDIFEKKDNLNLIVAEYLKDLIFHDLKKVKPMFRDVLGCEFGDISWLFTAVNIRHHCVHRAGLDKDGNRVNISLDSIHQLVVDSSMLVKDIEREIYFNNQVNYDVL